MDHKDLPEHMQDVLSQLESIKTTIHGLAINLLMVGELKPPSLNIPEWERYPYDHDFYIENSIDPKVQSLNDLKKKVEETILSLTNGHGE